jgi:hypothetical protein
VSFARPQDFRRAAWAPVSAAHAEAPAGPRYLFVSLLMLIGLVIPAWEGRIMIAGAKFTAGRLAVTLLVIPALIVLARGRRRFLVCDAAVLLTTLWMMAASASTAGAAGLSSTTAESLQLLFAYVVGRAFYFEQAALDGFIRALLAFTALTVLIAAGEVATGRWLAHEFVGALSGTPPLTAVFRDNLVRATSTLDHPILLGVFCALVNAIALFWARSAMQRIALSLMCLAGCMLSQSSASLMAYVLGVAAYGYDRLLSNFAARWTLFWAVVGSIVAAVFLAAEHPIGWLISHLTLDPVTGYYRILIWEAAFLRIDQSPWTGFSFELFDNQILDATIDCVWLVEALRYGIPASALLFWANLAAVWPSSQQAGPVQHNLESYGSAGQDQSADVDRRMNLAFTIVVLLFMFSGITVHFWNYIWIFWGLCLGIKTSLRERMRASTSGGAR